MTARKVHPAAVAAVDSPHSERPFPPPCTRLTSGDSSGRFLPIGSEGSRRTNVAHVSSGGTNMVVEEEEEGDGDGGFAAGDSLFHRSRARYRMFADAIATNFGVDDLEPDFFADMWRKESLNTRQGATSPTDDVEDQYLALQGSSAQWDSPFKFSYKGRLCEGKAIHIAALHPRGAALLDQLLLHKADLNAEFTYDSRGGSGSATALQLAAGSGHVAVLKRLVKAGANVNRRAKLDGEDNIPALYDAVLFNRVAAVDFLLQSMADVNASSKHGTTPMHLAAKHGITDVVPTLLHNKANLSALDEEDNTPLDIAIMNGQYPISELHYLSTHSMEELLEVARISPEAASALIRRSVTMARSPEELGPRSVSTRDRTLSGRIGIDRSTTPQHIAWMNGMDTQAVDIESWIELMELAPAAAAHLLDGLTVAPRAPDVHHPLPKQAFLFPKEVIRSYYCTDKQWTWHGRAPDFYPKWHDYLTRGCAGVSAKRAANREPKAATGAMGMIASWQQLFLGGEQKITGVYIRLVTLGGILHPRVLHSLGKTTYYPIFGKVATQGALDFSWNAMAWSSYMLNVFYSIVEMMILICWTLPPDKIYQQTAQWAAASQSEGAGDGNSTWTAPSRPRVDVSDLGHNDQLLAKTMWSIFFVLTTMHAINEVSEFIGYCMLLQKPMEYFSLKSAADIVTIMVAVVLCHELWESYVPLVDQHELLSVIVIMRWFQFMYMFRGFEVAGRMLLPILNSFLPVRGMMLITVFSFVAFFHGYLILEGIESDYENAVQVFLNSYRFLFVGDGDGIDGVLGVGGKPTTGDALTRLIFVAAVLVFCLCALNLFIAVHSEAYDQAKENAPAAFLQERARMCLQSFLRPTWVGPSIRYKKSVVVLIFVVVVPIWLMLVKEHPGEMHPSFPSALLLFAIMVANAIINARPWLSTWYGGHSNCDRTYLWLCVRGDYSEEDFLPAGSRCSAGELDGRLLALKRDGMLRVKQMAAVMEEQTCQLRKEMLILRQGIARLHHSLHGKADIKELSPDAGAGRCFDHLVSPPAGKPPSTYMSLKTMSLTDSQLAMDAVLDLPVPKFSPGRWTSAATSGHSSHDAPPHGNFVHSPKFNGTTRLRGMPGAVSVGTTQLDKEKPAVCGHVALPVPGSCSPVGQAKGDGPPSNNGASASATCSSNPPPEAAVDEGRSAKHPTDAAHGEDHLE